MKICRSAVLLAMIGSLVVTDAFSPTTTTTITNSPRRIAHSPKTSTTLLKLSSSNDDNNGQKAFDFSNPLKPVIKGQTLNFPFSENIVDLGDGAVNDGPYSWIAPYLTLGGYEAGSSLKGGMVSKDKMSSRTLSEEEKEARRKKATEDMVNINDDERQRRRELSNLFYKVTAIYAGISSLILDDGSLVGHFWRFAIFIPLSTAYGFQLSAQRGLCNVAQRGLWDVSGELEPISDPTLARAMIEKVNKLNNDSGGLPLIVSLVWSLIPNETASGIGLAVLVVTILYFIEDKLPEQA
eukprot:scaffold3073_cov66-Cylindrotheca_fusiformis.AAC.25